MEEKKKIIIKLEESKVDEAHYIMAAVFATRVNENEMNLHEAADEVKSMYFAARRVLEMVVDKGTECGVPDELVVNDIATLMVGLKRVSKELGCEISDKNAKEIYKKSWAA